jgi:hypothetical protein
VGRGLPYNHAQSYMYSISVLRVVAPKVLLLFQLFLIAVRVASQVKLKKVSIMEIIWLNILATGIMKKIKSIKFVYRNIQKRTNSCSCLIGKGN